MATSLRRHRLAATLARRVARAPHYRKSCASIFTEDARTPNARQFDYGNGRAAPYELCMDTRVELAISHEFRHTHGLAPALAEFRDRDLMIRLDDQFLSLALLKHVYI